jgi:hypothetical protein
MTPRRVYPGAKSILRPDDQANRKVYGREATASAIIAESKYEAEGRKIFAILQKASPSVEAPIGTHRQKRASRLTLLNSR